MSKMTAAHLEAVNDAIRFVARRANDLYAMGLHKAAEIWRNDAARLSEVAAHIAAQIERNDDAG
jgi:hypothetical protein